MTESYCYLETGSIRREPDGAVIPCDPNNRDYRRLMESGAAVAPYAAPEPKPKKPAGGRFEIEVGGQRYTISPADGPRLAGAMWQAAKRTVELALEGGQALTIGPATLETIAAQLAPPMPAKKDKP